jgi:hypothetical protein
VTQTPPVFSLTDFEQALPSTEKVLNQNAVAKENLIHVLLDLRQIIPSGLHVRQNDSCATLIDPNITEVTHNQFRPPESGFIILRQKCQAA